jgi:hypothetical protein
MEPIYESTDSQPGLTILLALVGVLMVVMGVFAPPDEQAPVWLMWFLRLVLVFFGVLIFVVLPIVRIRAFPEYVEVTYGLLKLIRFRLETAKIVKVEAVIYNPLMEFGGWGIKGGWGRFAGYTAYTSSITNRALAIKTTEKSYLLGCPNPEEAEMMINGILNNK